MTQQLFATRGTQQFKPYSAPADAPVYDYKLAGHNINTKAMKDTAGQEWYLTDGGQWRNTTTKQAQANMPSYGPQTVNTMAQPAPAAAPAPAAPVATQPTPPPVWKSVQDFLPTAQKDALNIPGQPTFGTAPTMQAAAAPQAARTMDFVPKNWQETPTYKYALDMANRDNDRRLSSMGLLGSGAELEQRAQSQARVEADEMQRLLQIANTDANNQNQMNQMGYQYANDANRQNYETEVNRQNLQYNNQAQERQALQQLLGQLSSTDFQTYHSNLNQEANREIDKDNQRLVGTQTALDFIKSLNPMQYGYQALGSTADLDKQLGQVLSAATGGGGGGGGGRAPAAPIVSPNASLPTSVNTFNPTNYWLGAANSIIPNLIGAFNK
jgi:chemotaxis protein histidine kinase CheA